MALIKCTECGKEISDSAMACPHCGCQTPHAKKAEEFKALMRISRTVNLICIASEVLGVILFLSGFFELQDYGYSLFLDNWASSYRDSVVSAGTRGIIGLVLWIIGFVSSILYSKYYHRITNNLYSSTTFSPRNEKLEKVFRNLSSVPKSEKKCCPYCGDVLTSNRCNMCGKEISSPKNNIPSYWICPNCEQKNLSTRTSCWRCNHQL